MAHPSHSNTNESKDGEKIKDKSKDGEKIKDESKDGEKIKDESRPYDDDNGPHPLNPPLPRLGEGD